MVLARHHKELDALLGMLEWGDPQCQRKGGRIGRSYPLTRDLMAVRRACRLNAPQRACEVGSTSRWLKGAPISPSGE